MSVAGFIMDYFIPITIIAALVIIVLKYIRSQAAMRIFHNLDLRRIKYEEQRVSGFSTKSLLTQFGGAQRALKVTITDKELAITCPWFWAVDIKRSDMLHRIPLRNIIRTKIKERFFRSYLFIQFKDQNGKFKEIALKSKDNEQLQRLLNPAA